MIKMPSKKAMRKAAAKGTTVEARRAEADSRAAERKAAQEAKVERMMNDPTVNSQLHEAIRNTESFNDLWDNPMVREARKNMTPEQLEQYERLGREMYGTLDFENVSESKVQDDIDAVKYIESALRAGLRPCDLEDNEKTFMENRYGENWYERYGGWGEPLPGATADDVATARRSNEDSFLRHFGGTRVNLQEELGGKR